MNNRDTMQVQSAEAFDSVQSSTWERLTNQVSRETFGEIVLIAMTTGLMTVLTYILYHALQNYQVFYQQIP